MSIDLDDPRPSYLQLADSLKADVARGHYGVGDRLPAVRDLAAKFKVSNATAARAVGVLQQDGIVVSRPGIGTVVRNPDAASEPSLTEQVRDLRRRIEALEASRAKR
jgi:GntR family transcriptional regulator